MVTGLLLMAALGCGAGGDLSPREAPPPEPLRVHMISGSREYRSEPSLEQFAAFLEQNYRVRCTISRAKDGSRGPLPNLEALDEADVLLVFCRRLRPPEEQTDRIRRWCEQGKPVVGVRTASHGFQTWLEFDEQVLGGSYNRHGGAETVRVVVEDSNANHPILDGVEGWQRRGKLYRNPDNADDTTLLMSGKGLESADVQPLAWARVYDEDKGGRAFYTSMGLPHDFENPNFRRMLVNAIFWVAARDGEGCRAAPSRLIPISKR